MVDHPLEGYIRGGPAPHHMHVHVYLTYTVSTALHACRARAMAQPVGSSPPLACWVEALACSWR